MYRAGLTAQGCWDSMDQYDREAIEKFAELIIEEERMMACELIDSYAKALKVAILNGGE